MIGSHIGGIPEIVKQEYLVEPTAHVSVWKNKILDVLNIQKNGVYQYPNLDKYFVDVQVKEFLHIINA